MRITLVQQMGWYDARQTTRSLGEDLMSHTAMDRWMEAAEARRVCQIAHQMQPPSKAPTLQNSFMKKLRSMVLPQISPCRAPRVAATRSAA
jgi:hypothetical protein